MTDKSDSELLDAIKSMVDSGGVLGILDPLQKGILSAVNRLVGAAIDIPAAYLDGWAEEKRSLTDARKQVRMGAADTIVKGMELDKNFSERAFQRDASKILRQQQNVEDIAAIALEDLSGSDAAPDKEVSQEFLDEFEREASTKSSDEMKLLFGKILSGEIQNPGKFSTRTIRAVGQMDTRTASLFQKFCSLVANNSVDARVISLGGNAGQNCLQEFGLNYGQLNILREFNLINSDYHSYIEYGQIVNTNFPLHYASKYYFLSTIEASKPPGTLRVHGVALTSIGKELLPIVDIVEDLNYSKKLSEFFKNVNVDMKLK